MNELSTDDVAFIKRTWAIPMKTPDESGVAILYKFFERYPHNQQKFDLFKNVPLAELKNQLSFRKHAGRIITVLDNVINSLETEKPTEKLLSILKPIGSSHFRRNIPKKSFDELKDVLLDILKAVCNLNDEQSEIWLNLLNNAYYIIFGVMDELAETAK